MAKKKIDKIGMLKEEVRSLTKERMELEVQLASARHANAEYNIFVKNIAAMFDYTQPIDNEYGLRRNSEIKVTPEEIIVKGVTNVKMEVARERERANGEERKSQILQNFLYSVINKEGFLQDKENEMVLIQAGYVRDPQLGNQWVKFGDNHLRRY